MLKRLSLGGNPNIGVYAAATESHVFVAGSATKKEILSLEEALEVEAVRLTVGGTNLVGALLSANSHGVVVSNILTDREEDILSRTGLEIVTLDDTLNAAGNMLLATDRGVIAGVDYPEEAVGMIEDALRVKLTPTTVADLVTVGMAAAATTRGVLMHPKAGPEERETIRRALKADVMPGTINHGTALIGAGLVANSHGAAIGSATTGIEIGRIDEALGFLGATASH